MAALAVVLATLEPARKLGQSSSLRAPPCAASSQAHSLTVVAGCNCRARPAAGEPDDVSGQQGLVAALDAYRSVDPVPDLQTP